MRKSLKPALAAAASLLSFGAAAQTSPTAEQLKYFQDRALALVPMFSGYTLAGAEQAFTAGDTVVDADGTQHVRIHRKFRGLRVLGGDMVMHVIVDASTNRLLKAWDDVQAVAATDTGKAMFVGTVSISTDLTGSTYSLKDPTRGNRQVVTLNNTGWTAAFA